MKEETLASKVEQIKMALDLDASLSMPAAIKMANEAMGLPNEGTLPAQADVLLAQLG